MTYAEFKKWLTSLSMFTNAEVHKIARTTGEYTPGNAVIACEISGIELHGSDVDAMFASFEDSL